MREWNPAKVDCVSGLLVYFCFLLKRQAIVSGSRPLAA